MMKELSERVRFAMEKHNLNANSLAKLVGISRPAMIKILDGETKEPKKILEIAEALNVSPEWLKTGKGDTPDFSEEVEDEEENGHLVRVEVLDVYASAGNGEFLTGDLAGDIQAVEFASEYFYNLFQRASEKGMAIVNVKGDSMEPTLSSGDLLFVDTTRTYYQGDGLYVFSFGDSLYVKRLQRAGYKLLVLSDNKFYDTWDVNESNEDQFFIHGKVEFLQGKIRRVG